MNYLSTKNALKPSGHYSQAIVDKDIIYISAQLPIDPMTGEKKLGLIEEEAEQILKNIELILLEAGCNRNNVIKTTVFITDINLWGEVNNTYKNFFQDHKPARSIVSVNALHYGARIAIEAIASKT